MLRIVRLPAVLHKCGRGKTAFYGDFQAGLFTRAVNLGARARGWPEHEVDALASARVAGADDDSIRRLVVELHALRRPLAGATDDEVRVAVRRVVAKCIGQKAAA